MENQLLVINTISQEQSDFVYKFLVEEKGFKPLSCKLNRYIGICNWKIVHCNHPPDSESWHGYTKISVDKLFKELSSDIKLGGKVKDKQGNVFTIIRSYKNFYLLNEDYIFNTMGFSTLKQIKQAGFEKAE